MLDFNFKNNINIYELLYKYLFFIYNKIKCNDIINIKIINKYEILNFNFKYRKKYKITNSLTFFINCDIYNSYFYLGDIIICYEVIYKEAYINNKKFIFYLLEIYVHSILHLFGYNHIYSYDYIKMKKIEKIFLKELES